MAAPYFRLGSLTLRGLDPETGARWSVRPREVFGLGGAPARTSLVDRPRQDGAWLGESYVGAKHIAVGGLLQAPSEAAMWASRDKLMEAASARQDTTLTMVRDDGDRWWTVRREDEVLWDVLTPESALWSVQLVAADPRWFGTGVSGVVGLPASSGGLTVPFTVPFTVDSVVQRGQVSLTNPGNTAGPVVMRIDGPVTGPVVTHVSSGRSLVFSSSVVLGAGEWIDVDMEARTVLANGQASRNGWVTSRGWSQFEPGVNTWSFTAAVYDPDSRLTVSATPAWV